MYLPNDTAVSIYIHVKEKKCFKPTWIENHMPHNSIGISSGCRNDEQRLLILYKR